MIGMMGQNNHSGTYNYLLMDIFVDYLIDIGILIDFLVEYLINISIGVDSCCLICFGLYKIQMCLLCDPRIEKKDI